MICMCTLPICLIKQQNQHFMASIDNQQNTMDDDDDDDDDNDDS